jgi:regulator of sirC expression with transglutaminase-like and TPR domain
VAQQAEQLSHFLFQMKGFRGHTEDYGDPRNSFLNDVLDRRLGIPITLSVLYLEVAGRLDVPAYGIGLPGHFIVGVHNDSEDLWLDPFFGGRSLTLADCADLLRLSINYEGPIEAAWFVPAAPRTILARMLNNLRVTYVQRRMWREAIAVIQQLRYIQPDVAEHLRDLGLVHYRQRSLPQAAHYLNAYLEQAPQAEDAQHIREGVKAILDEWAAMN